MELSPAIKTQKFNSLLSGSQREVQRKKSSETEKWLYLSRREPWDFDFEQGLTTIEKKWLDFGFWPDIEQRQLSFDWDREEMTLSFEQSRDDIEFWAE